MKIRIKIMLGFLILAFMLAVAGVFMPERLGRGTALQHVVPGPVTRQVADVMADVTTGRNREFADWLFSVWGCWGISCCGWAGPW